MMHQRRYGINTSYLPAAGRLDGTGKGRPGTPYWFGTNESEKHICAPVEPGGLLFEGFMDDEEWATWVSTIKEIATQALYYKAGEVAWGEVDE